MNNAALDRLYSPKQQRVLRRYYSHRPYMLINHGAVRTGKTTVDNDIFLAELLRIHRYAEAHGIEQPQYILGGASINNINRNVIRELNQSYGLGIKLSAKNEFTLFGVVVCCLGTDDLGRLAGAVGMTSYGLYLNEASIAKEEVFDELLKRCSGDKDFAPMVIVDTNPDSPEHYLFKNYISLPFDVRKQKGFLTYHWELDDNPFLNPQVKANIIASTPSGVFYDRKIRGLWVTAEGIVYEDFDKSVHVLDDDEAFAKNEFVRFYAAVDWGYEHKGVIVLIGVTAADEHIILRVIARRHQLTDWWAARAQELRQEFGLDVKFYCDSARPDNIRQFREAGIWAVEANKAINAGIECVAGLWKTRRLFILRSQAAEFLQEIYGYIWDERTGQPVKVNDDIMDAVRYGVYSDALAHRAKR